MVRISALPGSGGVDSAVMRTAPLLIAAAYLVFTAVPLAGVVQAALDTAWNPPFPTAAMAGLCVLLVSSSMIWLGVGRGNQLSRTLAAWAGVVALVIGLVGVWGSWVSVGEPCSDLPTASLVTSFPVGACERAGEGGSLLVGGYLIAVGALGGASLVVLDRRRGGVLR